MLFTPFRKLLIIFIVSLQLNAMHKTPTTPENNYVPKAYRSSRSIMTDLTQKQLLVSAIGASEDENIQIVYKPLVPSHTTLKKNYRCEKQRCSPELLQEMAELNYDYLSTIGQRFIDEALANIKVEAIEDLNDVLLKNTLDTDLKSIITKVLENINKEAFDKELQHYDMSDCSDDEELGGDATDAEDVIV